MADTQKLQAIMQQEVSRKEFLRYLGIALLCLLGVNNIIQNFQKSLLLPNKTRQTSTPVGYGMNAYGR